VTLTPPDPAWYQVDVSAGTYSWTTAKGDPPTWGLADPLTVGWAVPENGLAFTQPDPMQAAFTLALQSMADVADLDVGDPVAIFVTLDSTEYPGDSLNHIVSFRGRVAGVRMRPRKGGGVLVTVVCVDYSVDLAESPVGTADWPAEKVQPRTDRIAAEAGVAVPPTWPPLIGANIDLAARTGAQTDARSAFVRMLDTAGGAAGGGYKLYLTSHYPVDSITDPAPDPLEPFEYWTDVYTERDAGSAAAGFYTLPGSLQLLDSGLWGIVIDELPADAGQQGHINADYVDLSAEWALTKNDRPDTIVVTGPYTLPTAGVTKVTAQAPDPVPVTTVIDTDLIDYQNAQILADLNLTSHDSDRWAAEEFTFRADLDPTRLTRPGIWFNDATVVQLSAPLAVSPIPEDQNPSGIDWFAGTLVAAGFTLAGGRFSATLRLSRRLPRPKVQVGTDLGYLAPSQLETFKPDGAGLIANPGFEVNAAGYTGSNATLTRTLAQAHSGVASLSVAAVAAGNALAVDSGSGVGGLPVVAGKTYRVPVWSRAAATGRSIQLRVDWWTAAGAFISTTIGTAVADVVGAWTAITEKVLAPATAARARRQYVVAGAALGEVHYADDFDMWRTLTYADLDPRFSYYDYRIVRNPNA
jgi:hypothetical protein